MDECVHLALDTEEFAQDGHVMELDAEGSPRVRLERHERRLGHLPPRDALARMRELVPRFGRRRLRPLEGRGVAQRRLLLLRRGRRGRRVGRAVLDVGGGRALGVAGGGERRLLVLLLELLLVMEGRGEGGLVLEEEVGEHEIEGVLPELGVRGEGVGVHPHGGGVGGRGGAMPRGGEGGGARVVAVRRHLGVAAAPHRGSGFRAARLGWVGRWRRRRCREVEEGKRGGAEN